MDKITRLLLFFLCTVVVVYSLPQPHSDESKDSSSSSSSSNESRDKNQKHQQFVNHQSEESSSSSSNESKETFKNPHKVESQNNGKLPRIQKRYTHTNAHQGTPDSYTSTQTGGSSSTSSLQEPKSPYIYSQSADDNKARQERGSDDHQTPPVPSGVNFTLQKSVPYQAFKDQNGNSPENQSNDNQRQVRNTDHNDSSYSAILSATTEDNLTPQKPIPDQGSNIQNENLRVTKTVDNLNRQVRNTYTQQSPPSAIASAPTEVNLTPQTPVQYQDSNYQNRNPPVTQTNGNQRQVRDTDNQESPSTAVSSDTIERNLTPQRSSLPYQRSDIQNENSPSPARTESNVNRQISNTYTAQSLPGALASDPTGVSTKPQKSVPDQGSNNQNRHSTVAQRSGNQRQVRNTDNQYSSSSALPSATTEGNLTPQRPIPYQGYNFQNENSAVSKTEGNFKRQVRNTYTQQSLPSAIASVPTGVNLTPQKPVPYQESNNQNGHSPVPQTSRNQRQVRNTDNQHSSSSASPSATTEGYLTPQKPIPYQRSNIQNENSPSVAKTENHLNRQVRNTYTQQSPPSAIASAPTGINLTPQKPVPYQESNYQNKNSPVAETSGNRGQVRNTDSQHSSSSVLPSATTEENLTPQRPVPYKRSNIQNENPPSVARTEGNLNRQVRSTYTDPSPPGALVSAPTEVNIIPQNPVPHQGVNDQNAHSPVGQPSATTSGNVTPQKPVSQRSSNQRQARNTNNQYSSSSALPSATAEVNLTPQRPVPYQRSNIQTENAPSVTRTEGNLNRQIRNTYTEQSPPSALASAPTGVNVTPQKPVPYEGSNTQNGHLPAAQTNGNRRQIRNRDNQYTSSSTSSSVVTEGTSTPEKPVLYKESNIQTGQQNLPLLVATKSSSISSPEDPNRLSNNQNRQRRETVGQLYHSSVLDSSSSADSSTKKPEYSSINYQNIKTKQHVRREATGEGSTAESTVEPDLVDIIKLSDSPPYPEE